MLGILNFPSTPSSFALPQSRRGKMFARAAMAAEVAPPSSAAEDRQKSLYEVLRVKRNASQVEIRSAYRTLAKLYHPDANSRFMDSSIATTSDGRDFIEIHNAYATLSDPDARSVYDSNLTVNSQRPWSGAGVSGDRRSPGRGRFYQTRRWETDQCW